MARHFLLAVFICISVAFSLALAWDAEEIVCPEQQPDDAFVKQFPSERDCGVFYKCDRGKAIMNKCPTGLHYNRYNQACDFPVRAKCPLNDLV